MENGFDRHNERLRAYAAERDKALMAMDLDWAERELATEGHSVETEVLLAAMHKTRYELPSIPAPLRRMSRRWLEERGLMRIGYLAWPEGDRLP